MRYFDENFFECYLAYAHRRGISRELGKASRELLQRCFESAEVSEQVECVFDEAIRLIRETGLRPPPPPPPRPRAVPPPDTPVRIEEQTIAIRSVRAQELVDDYTEVVYDPPSKLPVDLQIRGGFHDRMRGIDWDYYLQSD